MKTTARLIILLVAVLAAAQCENKPVNDWIYYQTVVTDPPAPEERKPYDTLRWEAARAEALAMRADVVNSLGPSPTGGTFYRNSADLDEKAARAADDHYRIAKASAEVPFTIVLYKVFSSADNDRPIRKSLGTFEYGHKEN